MGIHSEHAIATKETSRFGVGQIISLAEEAINVSKKSGVPKKIRDYRNCFPHTKGLKLSSRDEAIILGAILTEKVWATFLATQCNESPPVLITNAERADWLTNNLKLFDPLHPRPGSDPTKLFDPIPNKDLLYLQPDFHSYYERAKKVFAKNTFGPLGLGMFAETVTDRDPLEAIQIGFSTANTMFYRSLRYTLFRSSLPTYQELEDAAKLRLSEWRKIAHTAGPIESGFRAKDGKVFARAGGENGRGPTSFTQSESERIIREARVTAKFRFMDKDSLNPMGCSALYAKGSFPFSSLGNNKHRSVFEECFELYYLLIRSKLQSIDSSKADSKNDQKFSMSSS